ncbi:MAG: chemotaxis protein CheW [Desulfatiglans sp.]|jgi:purine-binding chemotaxis protein CheW|nr:chemotaxis protein CheW [Thermodesulfobacteriota bacterium]MEE4351450.1 chemotaxis protein CheW [Desulfatiglans sp.]
MTPHGTETTSNESHPTTDILIIRIATRLIGVDILQVEEIVQMVEPKPLANAPAFVEGVISLRGEIVPLVRLSKILDLPAVPIDPDMYVVIARTEGKKMGLMVDGIDRVVSARLIRTHLSESLTNHSLLKGLIELQNELVEVLDCDVLPMSSDRESFKHSSKDSLDQAVDQGLHSEPADSFQHHSGERIGDLFLRESIITRRELDEALEEHKRVGGFLGMIFVKRGLVTEGQLLEKVLEQQEERKGFRRSERGTLPHASPDKKAAEILRKRAENLARIEMQVTDDPERWMVFLLNQDRYGVSIDVVDEIISDFKISRLPSLPGYIRGITNLRGEITPIINTKELIGVNDKTEKKKGHNGLVILMKHGRSKAGFLVDEVIRNIEISPEKIETPFMTSGRLKEEFLRGQTQLNQGLLILLDGQKMIDHARV